jgi:predicted O-methyltransferase YrrM
MPDDEGLALYAAARRAARVGPLLEIGSWCGKSAVYLGAAAEEAGTVLFSVDHHRGSEELQAGWEHHDPDVVDPRTGRIDTLPELRRTIEEAGLEATVIAVVGESTTVAAHWGCELGMVFIDGGHGSAPAHADYRGWSPWVRAGGLLAVHDVFPDPAAGGRPPFEVWTAAAASGRFVDEPHAGVGSLKVLRRLAIAAPPCEK